jgi:hypothetical protein
MNAPLATDPVDDFEDFDEPEECAEGWDECRGFFENTSPSAVFVCGAVGSEDCDECPMRDWLGLTNKQIDEVEAEYDGK